MNNDNSPQQNAATIPVVSQSVDDADTPGVQVEYDAREAELNGAFEETAMSEADAWEANADLAADDPHGTAIVVSGQAVRQSKQPEGD